MSLRALTKNKQGFTIIEVMIVLAIAGLIVLVVFMAVPALQRNSRNTQRKQDVQSVLGGIQEWISLNGSNEIPNTIAKAKVIADSVGFTYYNPPDVYIDGVTVSVSTGNVDPLDNASRGTATSVNLPTTAETPDPNDKDFIYIWTGADCSGITSPVTVDRASSAGPSRAIAVEFTVETASGSQVECRTF